MKEIIPIKQHIDKIIRENGSHLNFTLDYKVEVKIRDGKPVSIIWRKELKDLKNIFKADI